MKDYNYYGIEMHQDDGEIVHIIGHRPRKGSVLIYVQGRVMHKCKVLEKPEITENNVICKVKVIRECMR